MTEGRHVQEGDRLLECVLSSGDEEASVQLLSEFFAGYPVERLCLLLCSENEAAAKAGAWIASELGEKAALVLDCLSEALEHQAKYVRFFALDSLLLAAGPNRGDVLGKATRLIADEDAAVRWKLMNVLARASEDQLRSSIPFTEDHHQSELVTQLLTLDRDHIEALCVSANAVERRFAAIAGGRYAFEGDRSLLRLISIGSDPECAQFATDLLDDLSR